MRSRSILVSLFIVFALPTVLVQVFLTPPTQVADEGNHFLRALQVSTGHLFGYRIAGGTAGGLLDPQASVFAHAFDALKFDPSKKLDPAVVADVANERWGSAPDTPADFGNTANYPFFLYLPASIALLGGRLADLSVLDTFFLARLATALASVALGALALRICGQGRTLLFVVLCFPMTLSLFASVSQDAMSIALGALAIALWTRFVTRRMDLTAGARTVVSLSLGAVAAGRVPLFPLCILALLPTVPPRRGSRPSFNDVAAASSGLVPLLIGLYGVYRAKVPFRVGDGVSPGLQLRWLVLHPLRGIEVAFRTLWVNASPLAHQMIGVLGWLDTMLPPGFYPWMGFCVITGVLLDVLEPNRVFIPGWGWLPPLAAIAAAAAIFSAFYLAWTPVGAPTVEGVQGRYFLLPAIALAVSLPRFCTLKTSAAARVREVAQVVLCGAVAVADLWIVPITIFHRYYG